MGAATYSRPRTVGIDDAVHAGVGAEDALLRVEPEGQAVGVRHV